MKTSLPILLATGFLFSSCGTLKLYDNSVTLSDPLSMTDSWKITAQGYPEVSGNKILEVMDDSIKITGNLGTASRPLSSVTSVTRILDFNFEKTRVTEVSMKKEGGLLLGGIVGSSAALALTDGKSDNTKVVAGLTGAAAGAALGYFTGEYIRLTNSDPLQTTLSLAGKSPAEKKQAISDLMKK
ncbi:MAG: hypothetical protein L6Q77_02000 [Bacteroidetes bacterium]|nr:hypothetical protein [Bacteroidota bacterium]